MTGKYVGSGFINSRGAIHDRLWKRVQDQRRTASEGHEEAGKWAKPGLIGRVKPLRGENDLRHASLQDSEMRPNPDCQWRLGENLPRIPDDA
ncbi:hypothetical protein FJ976_17240 [Mesorhizobium sp. B1-1-9]|uniref:hypothetical protein n=1 Tax=Mesorhizobium sp. B1-1-9 TaxID=2589975 RepID=UPI00112D77BB|nr:hypothetical protein [Mesorhizobium sp. B1-1-9]TPN49475.1 hypothetical protein FJ976_17240 [Mesorhizobium sp. B1-1-9]